MPSGLWLSNQSMTMAAKTRAKGLSLPSKGPIVHCVLGWGGRTGFSEKYSVSKLYPPPKKKNDNNYI